MHAAIARRGPTGRNNQISSASMAPNWSSTNAWYTHKRSPTTSYAALIESVNRGRYSTSREKALRTVSSHPHDVASRTWLKTSMYDQEMVKKAAARIVVHPSAHTA